MHEHSNPDVAIVADDLSGAADCAAAFAADGRAAVVWLAPDAGVPGGILACSAGSRDLAVADAARATARAFEALLAHRPRAWFMKIDSTLRGHLAAELEVAIDRIDPAVTVVAPSFPSTGRTLTGGRAYVHGEPLERTGLWRGPDLGEVAHLPAMLAAGSVATVAIDRAQIASGELARRLASPAGGEVLVVDAHTDGDLRALVASGRDCGHAVLWVGSAGLAAALAETLAPATAAGSLETLEPRPAPVAGTDASGSREDGPALVAVGSLAAATRRQLAALQEHGASTTVLSPAELLGPADGPRRTLAAHLELALSRGCDAAVAIEGTAERDPELGGRLADRLGELLADFAPRFGGLVLTGGDTARGVLTAAGVRALRITGSVAPGIPASTSLPGAMRIVTKAGGFGGDDALARAVGFLRGGPIR